MSDDGNDLPFTGERFTPECVREIWYEHWHRYAFARPLARGRRVLDAACGEGYGSALLADVAGSVVAVDIDDTTIEHARRRYASHANLEFRRDDVTALGALPEASFDLVCCFETLEHVEAQDALLAGFARLLGPGGLLLVSSPDKAEYSDARGFRNEFHLREIYRDELEALLGRHFAHRRLFAQKLLFQSALWSVDGADARADPGDDRSAGETATLAVTTSRAGAIEPGFGHAPMYYLAACSQSPLPPLPAAHLFGDAEESVYRHYDAEVRKNMAAGERIAELERQLARFQKGDGGN
ncbi:MAG TPA: class I SAM-dependent methyltransferase [Rhodanobacteraceae bacterium]|nr:class I SAM-dependent methyltransferase [Rhodanobacteraceae bacterium]